MARNNNNDRSDKEIQDEISRRITVSGSNYRYNDEEESEHTVEYLLHFKHTFFHKVESRTRMGIASDVAAYTNGSSIPTMNPRVMVNMLDKKFLTYKAVDQEVVLLTPPKAYVDVEVYLSHGEYSDSVTVYTKYRVRVYANRRQNGPGKPYVIWGEIGTGPDDVEQIGKPFTVMQPFKTEYYD
jgi:hypothetical protein